MNATRLQAASNITMTLLLVLVVVLMVQLSRSWQNERFLDATINKHTTTSTKTIK